MVSDHHGAGAIGELMAVGAREGGAHIMADWEAEYEAGGKQQKQSAVDGAKAAIRPSEALL